MSLRDDICRCFPREQECKDKGNCARYHSDTHPKAWVSVADFSAWLESGSECVMLIRKDK